MEKFRVAIDGPAGSGKSTISNYIAKELGFTHIDTGAMYRAVTLAAIKKKVDLYDEKSYHFLETTKIAYENNHIYLDGVNVEKEIRSQAVTNNVSLVSSFPYVREKMVECQQAVVKQGLIIMDGRDIGTVVIPDAELKIFLTAEVVERAKRRKRQLQSSGVDECIDNVIADIKKRDQKDTTRAMSPLVKASDAIEVDTSNLTIEQTINKIIDLINGARRKQ